MSSHAVTIEIKRGRFEPFYPRPLRVPPLEAAELEEVVGRLPIDLSAALDGERGAVPCIRGSAS
jgi:hypothetical protein